MPPIRRSTIAQTEQALGVPMSASSEYAQSAEYVNFREEDIRLTAFAIAEAGRQFTEITPGMKLRYHLLHNLEKYIQDDESGISESLLRHHQQNVFHDIYGFLATDHKQEDGSSHNRGYIQLPTGSGKTAIFSTLVDALNAPLNDGDRNLKALVLVPNLDLVDQTVGVDGRRGFSQFAKDTSVTRYTGSSKDIDGDAVVMTYQSLPYALKNGAIDANTFDFIICDEAHRALGDVTRSALEVVANDKLLIGLTATPEFKSKNVGDLFYEKIHGLELREAIEIGLLRRVQGFAIGTDETIEAIGTGDYSDKDLAKLIHSEWRNNKAIEFTKSFIENGQQGIVSCIPGDDLKHARELADSLNQEGIIDPRTGELRPVRAAVAMGSKSERAALYQAFENGDIDVITYVDILTEGWDSDKATFLVNLRPTTSPVNAVQRLGRILRRTPEDNIATVIEFVDKSNKPLYTFFHAMEEDTLEQGRIFGRRNTPDTEGDTYGVSEGINDHPAELYLTPELIELIKAINHVELNKLIISPKGAPKDWYMIHDLASQLNRHAGTIEQVAEEAGMEVYQYRTEFNRLVRYFSPQDAERIKNILEESIAPEDWTSRTAAARTLGTSLERLNSLEDETGIAATRLRSQRGKIAFYYSPSQIEQLQTILQPVELAPEGAISRSRMLELYNLTDAGLKNICNLVDIEPKTARSVRGKTGRYFNVDQQNSITSFLANIDQDELSSYMKSARPLKNKEDIEQKIVFDETTHITSKKLQNELEISDTLLRDTAKALDIKGTLIGGSYGRVYSHEEAQRIRENAPREQVQTVDSLSYKGIAEQADTTQYFVKRAIGQLGLRGTVMRPAIGGAPTEFFNPEQQKQIIEKVRENDIPRAPDHYVSITMLKNESGRSMPYIQNLVSKLPVVQHAMRGKTGKTIYFTPEDADVIRNSWMTR